VEIDDQKRPVVVIDPRAGQGPGIGGFKAASEIGEAFKAGHAVYFLGFTATPIDGQQIVQRLVKSRAGEEPLSAVREVVG
jgi:hypothetical protein